MEHTVGGHKDSLLVRPFKRMNKDNKDLFLFFLANFGIGLGQFPVVLEGLGSSGRLVEIISAYPGTSPTPLCRAMAKSPGGGNLFSIYGIAL